MQRAPVTGTYSLNGRVRGGMIFAGFFLIHCMISYRFISFLSLHILFRFVSCRCVSFLTVQGTICNKGIRSGRGKLNNRTSKVWTSIMLVHGRWYRSSPGTPASYTTKTGGHDIAEILLKVALDTKIINQSFDTVNCCSKYL